LLNQTLNDPPNIQILLSIEKRVTTKISAKKEKLPKTILAKLIHSLPERTVLQIEHWYKTSLA
jgi:hypothetical protein